MEENLIPSRMPRKQYKYISQYTTPTKSTALKAYPSRFWIKMKLHANVMDLLVHTVRFATNL
jgi:hypothetical protein